MKRPSVLALLLLILPAGACHKSSSGGDDGANADDYFYDCEDTKKPAELTVYATDEAYRTFLDKIAASGLTKDDAQAAKLTAPAAGATLSLAAPPAFTFTSGMALRPTPVTPVPHPNRHRSRWAWVKDLFSIEGTAWAHCPNVTGSLYLLQLKEMGSDAAAYTALASVTTFTPTADVWKSKLAPLVGKKVTATLARGVFSTGEIQLGPFVATQDTSFTVGP
jgi:hypothetical protein